MNAGNLGLRNLGLAEPLDHGDDGVEVVEFSVNCWQLAVLHVLLEGLDGLPGEQGPGEWR